MIKSKSGRIIIRKAGLWLVIVPFLLLMMPTLTLRAAEKTSVPKIELTKAYNWKLVSPMAVGQNTNIGIVEFAKQLEQRTGGKVKITLYESTLGAPADHWDMAKNSAVQREIFPNAFLLGV